MSCEGPPSLATSLRIASGVFGIVQRSGSASSARNTATAIVSLCVSSPRWVGLNMAGPPPSVARLAALTRATHASWRKGRPRHVDNTNPNPMVEGPTLMLAPVHAKVRVPGRGSPPPADPDRPWERVLKPFLARFPASQLDAL